MASLRRYGCLSTPTVWLSRMRPWRRRMDGAYATAHQSDTCNTPLLTHSGRRLQLQWRTYQLRHCKVLSPRFAERTTDQHSPSVHNRTIPNVTLPNGAVFSLPQGDLFDLTTRGPRWDPLLNAYFYSVSFDTEPTTATVAAPSPTFTALPNPIDCASSLWWSTWWNKKPTPTLPPVDWLYFKGQWGDQQLSDLDPRQVDLFGYAYKYESGPTGPEDKNLARNEGVCLDSSDGCRIATALYSGA